MLNQDKALKGAVVNRALLSVHGGSHEIKVPLKLIYFL